MLEENNLGIRSLQRTHAIKEMMRRRPLFVAVAATACGALQQQFRCRPAQCRPEEDQPSGEVNLWSGGGYGGGYIAPYDAAVRAAVKPRRARDVEKEKVLAECLRDGLFVALFDDSIYYGTPSRMWFRGVDGVQHRGGGRPAVLRGDGTLEYWEDGQLHRANDLPAIEYGRGRRDWLVRGEYRRAADAGVAVPLLPAVVLADGTRVWVQPTTGLVHRDNGLPAIVRADGTLEFFENGMRHRANGLPAIDGLRAVRYFEHGREIVRPDSRGRVVEDRRNSGVITFDCIVPANSATRKSVGAWCEPI